MATEQPNRARDGTYAMPDDAPLSITDGLRRMNPKELKRRAEVVAQQARRAGNPTPREGLRALTRVRYYLESLELYAVANARGLGWSWADIAEELGISKQVLHRRYGKQFPKVRKRRPQLG